MRMRTIFLAIGLAAVGLALGESAVAKQAMIVTGTPGNRLGDEVLRDLISTPLGLALPRFQWRFRLIENGKVNAYSWGDGTIGMTVSLAWEFGNDRGLWAAVLSHEIGHIVILCPTCQPTFEAALQAAYQQAGIAPNAATGGKRGQLLGSGGGRQREYEADRVGLLIMAAAGYHPGYFLRMEQGFEYMMGDAPKQTSFLLGHPRWEDREQRTQAVYNSALALFNSRWPDSSKSPGGRLPPVGAMGQITASVDPQDGTLVLRVPVTVENPAEASNQDDPIALRVVAVFLDGRTVIQSSDVAYRSETGWLEVNSYVSVRPGNPTETLLRLPERAIPRSYQKFKAVVFLQMGEKTLSVARKDIDLERK